MHCLSAINYQMVIYEFFHYSRTFVISGFALYLKIKISSCFFGGFEKKKFEKDTTVFTLRGLAASANKPHPMQSRG